jgi:hypothetical protein
MGEKQHEPFPLSFNTSLKVDFQGSRGTSDGGLIWCASWMSGWVWTNSSPSISAIRGAARL